MNKKKIVYALGFFDGVHLGHQALLVACHHLAQRSGCLPGVVTFTTHPETLVTGHGPKLINSLEDRRRILLGHGMSELLVLPFDEKLRTQPWREFLDDLIEKGAAGFVCGDDFRFGFRGEGNAKLLGDFCREKGLQWAVVPGQNLNGHRVSSTHIRSLIENGQMEETVRFLGHPHLLSEKVVSGRQLGRTLGIPTANLQIPDNVVVPKYGVYACEALVEGRKYLAVTNVGVRPTVGGHHVTVEPWILDFDGDLYGKPITVLFYHFLRPEQAFPSLEELKTQIQRDGACVRRLLG